VDGALGRLLVEVGRRHHGGDHLQGDDMYFYSAMLIMKTAEITLKGQYHEIFDPLFILLNGTPGCPD
jgi:hypothetical protein